MKKTLSGFFSERRSHGAVLTSLFLAAVILLNVSVYLLATRFSWYLYTTERYTQENGAYSTAASRALEKPVTVRFCMEPEDMAKEAAYNLVYETAKQFADASDKVTLLDPFNIYADHRAVKAVAEKSGVSLSSSSVIVECGDNIRVLSFRDFFLLDSQQYITAYNGEEVFTAAFRWVQTENEKHPTVYFTKNHGENYAVTGLTLALALSGYRLEQIDLSIEAIPADCAAVVILNPIYDLEKAAAGTAVTAEYERLDRYLANGGHLYLSMDGGSDGYKDLENLRALLASHGLLTGDEPVFDYENAVTPNGKIIISTVTDSAIGRSVKTVHDAPVLVREATAISETPSDSVVTPLLRTAETAVCGTEQGEFTVAALSVLPSGGKIFVTTSGYTAYDDVMNSGSYANEELLYAVFGEFGCEDAPIGCKTLPMENNALENLTVGESNRLFVLLAVVLPVVIFILCFGVCLIRKRR